MPSTALATLDAHVEAVRQVAVADRIVISKTDLAETADLAALTARLAALNPGASQVDGRAPEASAAALVACGLYDPATKSADVRRWLGEAMRTTMTARATIMPGMASTTLASVRW